MSNSEQDPWLSEIGEQQDVLWRLARRLVRDEHGAQDLVQDAWLAALHGRVGDSKGKPAAGLLVTLASQVPAELRFGLSSHAPFAVTTPLEYWEEGHELGGWGTMTDGEGAFRIEIPRGSGKRILVVTLQGSLEPFEGPFEERAREVFLRLQELPGLRFILEDSEGGRADYP